MKLKEFLAELNKLATENNGAGEMEVNISIQTEDSYDTVLTVAVDHIKIAEDKIIIS